MKKENKVILTVVGATFLLAAAAGVVYSQTHQGEDSAYGVAKAVAGELEAVEVIEAMYLPVKDTWYFADMRTGSLFTAPIPEDGLFGMDGREIAQSDLRKGNILAIEGNGVMLESYPGQYPGVTRMQVISEGSEEDAAPYEEELARITPEADPSEPPFLNISYEQPQASVTAAIARGGYQWSYEDENGDQVSQVADTPVIFSWSELSDLSLDGETDLQLYFSEQPDQVQVERWTQEQKNAYQSGDPMPESEEVELIQEDGAYRIPGAVSGYVYLIRAAWPQGEAEYGFYTR